MLSLLLLLAIIGCGGSSQPPQPGPFQIGAGPMSGPVTITTTDSTVNYGDLVAGSAALPAGVNSTYIYARWTGYLVPSTSGVYTLGLNSDDGANLFVAGQPMVQDLQSNTSASTTLAYRVSATMSLTAGTFYPIVLEWQQRLSQFEIQLAWTPPGGSIQLIPSANLSTSNSSVTGKLTADWWNGNSTKWFP
jgi:PA14 domain